MYRPGPRDRSRRACAAAWAALLLSFGAAAGGGCRAAFRYPAESPKPSAAVTERLSADMNAFVLTGLVSDRLTIEVDWVAGARPSDEALAGLEATLRQYLPADKRVEILLDDEIPAAEPGPVDAAPAARAAALGRWLDGDPADWNNGDLVWVLSVPGNPEMLGVTTHAVVEREGRPVPVDTVLLFHDAIEREAALWVGTRKVERAILVHELGHVLGLVADPSHIERDNPRHCTEPGCVMAHPRARGQLYNAPAAFFAGKIPDDYCQRCRADIARAKEAWRAAAEADPAFVATLEDRRRARDARAEACWYAQRREWVEAAARFRRALELEGRDPLSTSTEGIALERLCDGGA